MEDSLVNDIDIKEMDILLRKIRQLCIKQQGTFDRCNNCPANKAGRLCHNGEQTPCAPYKWDDYKWEK